MKVYAVKHRDDKVIENSRSGGMFTAVSDLFLDGGYVYGCVLNDNLEAVHIGVSEKKDRDRMRGSKYVQSDLRQSFREIKERLDNNEKILFSGTPCQVVGLKSFLRKDYSNLFCVDIVCHGVPSPKVWKSYIQSYVNVVSVDFRNKKDFGWRNHIETITTDGKVINSKIWTNIFYSGNALRPSCYECPFKSYSHPGDITIADYWGIEKAAPEFDDNKGVSLVLVNTAKGKTMFELCKKNIIWKETCIEDSMQRAFIRPEERPLGRERFWRDYNTKGFPYLAKKYNGQGSILYRVLRKIKHIIVHMFYKQENQNAI